MDRSERWARQFGGDFPSIASVLYRSGWSRSVGGANPYMAIFTRSGIRPAQVNAALATGEILEMDAVRGCTYIVPVQDAPLAAALGGPIARRSAESDLRRLGFESGAAERQKESILSRWAIGEELTTSEVRERETESNVDFGSGGRRLGRTDLVALAISVLVGEGRLARVPIEGRLDRQRYRYRLCHTLARVADPEAEIVALYLRWAVSATVKDLLVFTGLSRSKAVAAMERLGIHLEGDQIHSAEADTSVGENPKGDPSASLSARVIASLDNFVHLDWQTRLPVSEMVGGWQSPNEKRGQIGAVTSLPHHAVVKGGSIVGLWEFSPRNSKLVYAGERDPEIDEQLFRAERMIAEELGDFRSFSQDSPRSREQAIHFLSNLAD